MKTEDWKKDLTPEQSDGLKACKTGEEAMAFCKEHGLAIPDELLDVIAGGQQSNNWFQRYFWGKHCPICDDGMIWQNGRWECYGCGNVFSDD